MSEATLSRMAVLRARIDYQGLILGTVCAVVTILLLIGQRVTFEPIKARLAEDRQAVLSQVLPPELYDNSPLEEVISLSDERISDKPFDVYIAKKGGAVSAVAFQVETEGYGGTITLMIGLRTNGEILGVRTLSHKETPGLADKIEIGMSNWITVFDGESLEKTQDQEWAVKKDGGKFDQFTGATITPRAVVRGVLNSLKFFEDNRTQLNGSNSLSSEETIDES